MVFKVIRQLLGKPQFVIQKPVSMICKTQSDLTCPMTSKNYLRIQPINKRALYSDILQAVLCQNISLPRFCINLLQHRNWMLMVTNRIAFAFVQVKGSNPQTIQSSGRGKCNCFYAYIRVPIKILIYKVVISDPHVVSLFGSSIIKKTMTR